MKETRQLMGMPITVDAVNASKETMESVFNWFVYVDETFSTYKQTSEISQINLGTITEKNYSKDMREVFRLSEETKKQTAGYFNICRPEGYIDPSGLVKGWAIYKAAKLLEKQGIQEFFIEAGGDIQVKSGQSKPFWKVGIQNPFNPKEIVKIISLTNKGIATSGTYERGNHIYNPNQPKATLADIVSLTVIAENIYEADRFATAAFAMGRNGIAFIEDISGFEGYSIDKDGIGTQTSGFGKYL